MGNNISYVISNKTEPAWKWKVKSKRSRGRGVVGGTDGDTWL